MRNAYVILVVKLEEKMSLENLGEDENIILSHLLPK
jgi:hypothetical protein